MQPRELVKEWVRRFNAADAEGIIELYSENAVNHQIVTEPLNGRKEIYNLFKIEFGRAKMVCNIENIFQDGEWAILEWSDPIGVRGCGFFHVQNDQIIFQRGYFDQLSFFRAQKLPIPDTYLDS